MTGAMLSSREGHNMHDKPCFPAGRGRAPPYSTQCASCRQAYKHHLPPCQKDHASSRHECRLCSRIDSHCDRIAVSVLGMPQTRRKAAPSQTPLQHHTKAYLQPCSQPLVCRYTTIPAPSTKACSTYAIICHAPPTNQALTTTQTESLLQQNYDTEQPLYNKQLLPEK